MGLKDEFNVLQPKINGVVAALTYGYFSHMNKAGVSSVSVTDESNKIQLSNIGKSNCGTNAIKTLVHGFQVAYNTNLINDDTVCDPKDIPNNCIMKDKNGYLQHGAEDELFIDYSINIIGKHDKMIASSNKLNDFKIGALESVCYGNDKFVAVAINLDLNWISVCYGNDKFVAVTYNNKYFAYSTDGINWTEGNISDTSRGWHSVCYGNDKFVTVAYQSNYFAYSTDGINWTESTISSTSRKWNSVCYGNGKFVAVGYDNYFAYSTDGINWIESTISSTSREWHSVCYGNDKFVTVAYNSKYFAYSTDGINWTESTISSTSRYWISVCYGNDKFVAVTYNNKYFAYSTDGINWIESTISSTSREWYSVCYGNGKFVAVAYQSKYFAYSTDGINWTESTISSTSRKWYSVCYGNDKFVTVTRDSNYFAYSTDGINWTELITKYNDFIYSTDGTSWTEGTISNASREWRSVCYGNDKFVAVAEYDNYFAYSTDGINWTEGTISSTSRYWHSVCYGNDKYVVVGDYDYFAYSTDGINWTEGTISNTSRNWRSVCYGNGKFVAVASSTNYFAYSTDGITWTEGTISSTSREWYSVCYGNGKFVAVSWDNYYAYSTDGINWTEGTISSGISGNWISVCYGNDKFVAISHYNNYYAYSTDGITWTVYTISSTSNWWYSICYGNDKFVIAAYDNYLILYPNCVSNKYNITEFKYKDNIIMNTYMYLSQFFNYQTREKFTTKHRIYNSSLSNTQTKIPSSNTIYIDHYLNIFYSSTNYSNIPINTITGSQILKDAITNGTAKFIANKFYVSSNWSDYNNEQFYRYLIFNDSDDNYYLAITSDMMSFTTYQLPEDNYSFGIMNGTIYMYIPSKDSIAMITRHPVTTDVITIDGNDPENTTDYTKPYYRLIEIPFLKKYYKYSGKHVKNVAIGVIGTMSNSTSIFGRYKYPSDCTLLINVFDKVYRIGVPNFNADNILANNSKRLQEFYTSDEQTSDNMNNILPVSSIIGKYDSSTTNISCNINSRHFDVVTDSNINITTDQMNIGYDSDIDETAPTTNKFISNYTYCGANSLSDLSTPASVIYPNANY